jgi:hypothetical protein
MGIATAGYVYEDILLSLELEVRNAMKAKPGGKRGNQCRRN